LYSFIMCPKYILIELSYGCWAMSKMAIWQCFRAITEWLLMREPSSHSSIKQPLTLK
jgi:hypothetical protein